MSHQILISHRNETKGTPYRERNPEPEPALKPSDRVRLTELEAEIRELRMENEFPKKPPS